MRLASTWTGIFVHFHRWKISWMVAVLVVCIICVASIKGEINMFYSSWETQFHEIAIDTQVSWEWKIRATIKEGKSLKFEEQRFSVAKVISDHELHSTFKKRFSTWPHGIVGAACPLRLIVWRNSSPDIGRFATDIIIFAPRATNISRGSMAPWCFGLRWSCRLTATAQVGFPKLSSIIYIWLPCRYCCTGLIFSNWFWWRGDIPTTVLVHMLLYDERKFKKMYQWAIQIRIKRDLTGKRVWKSVRTKRRNWLKAVLALYSQPKEF